MKYRAILTLVIVGTLPLKQAQTKQSISCFEQKQPAQELARSTSITREPDSTPVLIIGGGPAGLTAAIYLAQANIPTLVIGGDGQSALTQSLSVRNWPGVQDAPGNTIMKNIKNQVIKNKVKVLDESVVEMNLSNWPFIITTQENNSYKKNERRALSCIYATGSTPNLLGIPGESGPDGYWGKGVSNCAACEGSLFENKKVAVVGGGDSAIAEVNYLANIAKEVHIIVRKSYFLVQDIQAKATALNRPNVKVFFNTELKEIIGDGKKVTHITINNTHTDKTYQEECDGVFLAVGSTPNTNLIRGQVRLDENGYIKVTDFQSTSRKGFFAAGDVCDPFFGQAIISSGQGCMAALQAKRFLEDMGWFDTEKHSKDQENTNPKPKEVNPTSPLDKLNVQSTFPQRNT